MKGYPLAVDLAIYLLSLNVKVNNILTVAVSDSQDDSTIEEISSRLLNEIFTRDDASEEERDFLKSLSIFRGKVEKEEALVVIPQDLFDRTSRKLFNRNLLELNENFLELHPLIREFSYDKLDSKKHLHHKVSEYYIEKRNDVWEPELEAKIFHHLSCAEDWSKISDIIITAGRDIILHGYLDRLQQMITLVKDKGINIPMFDIYEGDIAQIKGEWDKALLFFEKAKQSLDEDVRIEGIIKYGEILYRQGNVKDSRGFFEEVISITENAVNNKWHARALNDLGLVYQFLGNLESALSFQNSALKIRQSLGDQEDVSTSLGNIGSIKNALGLKNEALELYEQSLKIAKEIGDKSGVARNLNNIGLIKSDFGFEKEALELYEQCWQIAKEIGDKSSIARSLNNIGSIKETFGFNMEALELHQQSLKIAKEIGDKSAIASSLNNIGYFSAKNNLEIEKACFYLLNSLAIFKFMSKPDDKTPKNHLFQMRKNIGSVNFESMVIEGVEKLDEELKNRIDINEILGKPVKVDKKPGRNEPCDCGSGKKYKQCCGKMN